MPGRRYGGGRGNRRGRRRASGDSKQEATLSEDDCGEVDRTDIEDEVDDRYEWELLVKNTFIAVSWCSAPLAQRSSRSTPASSREFHRHRPNFFTAALERPSCVSKKFDEGTKSVGSDAFEERVRAAVQEQLKLQTEGHVATLAQRVAELESENQALRTKAEAAKKVALKAVQAAQGNMQTLAIAELTLARAEQQANSLAIAANTFSKATEIPEEPGAVLLQAPLKSHPLRRGFSAVLAMNGVGSQPVHSSIEVTKAESDAELLCDSSSPRNTQDFIEEAYEKQTPSTNVRARPKMRFHEIPVSKAAPLHSRETSSGFGFPVLNATRSHSTKGADKIDDDAPCILGTFSSAFMVSAAFPTRSISK